MKKPSPADKQPDNEMRTPLALHANTNAPMPPKGYHIKVMLGDYGCFYTLVDQCRMPATHGSSILYTDLLFVSN